MTPMFWKKNKASQIKRLAKAVGIELNIKDKKIEIPNEKEQIKIVLSFLAEEVYTGPFSKDTYLTNSKRRIKNK